MNLTKWTTTTKHGPVWGPVNIYLAALLVAAAGRVLDKHGVPAATILATISVAGSVLIMASAVVSTLIGRGRSRQWFPVIATWGIVTIWPIFVIGDGWSALNVVFLTLLALVLGLLYGTTTTPGPTQVVTGVVADGGVAQVSGVVGDVHIDVDRPVPVGPLAGGPDPHKPLKDVTVRVAPSEEGWRFEMTYTHPVKGERKVAASANASAGDLVALIAMDRQDWRVG